MKRPRGKTESRWSGERVPGEPQGLRGTATTARMRAGVLCVAIFSLCAVVVVGAQTSLERYGDGGNAKKNQEYPGGMLGTEAGLAANRRCMQCHGQPHIATLDPQERRSMVGTWLDPDQPPPEVPSDVPLTGGEPEARPELYVDLAVLAGSHHDTVACVECHEDAARLPHAAKLNRATCARSCHVEAWEGYKRSAHGDALLRGDPDAPTCVSCHGGGHGILRISDRSAKQYRLNSLHLCGDCHAQHGPAADSATGVATYMGSVHARSVAKAGLLWAATCADCHDAHDVLPSSDPRSSVHRYQVSGTCGRCHQGVVEVFAHSVHGMLSRNENSSAPVCTDCHTAHQISRVADSKFFADIITECGDCHDEPVGKDGRLGSFYHTYLMSYHGKVTKLGGQRAARCSDCHGAHDILPLDDPLSRVHESNLIATCGQAGCHPKAGARFVQFDPHANHRDRKSYPVLFGVWLYFMIMIGSVFTFFGLHTVLWFVRSMLDKAGSRRAGRDGAPVGNEATGSAPRGSRTHIRRFTTLDRINHALVAITFFGLTATGIPLFFANHAWARFLADLWGGVEAAGIWHRFFAILLIANLFLHFAGIGRRFVRRRVPWYRWLFGPNSLVPRWKDVTDCIGMFRWFFGRGPRPRFDRWTYWEKFDYWAEIGGTFIIGGSGLLLWFPEYASLILPGWLFNVATIVHGFEALLAIGFIFTIHFFNAHLRPETFPVDEVIFTGSMTEEEFIHHRPAEYERLASSGELDALRVPAPDPARRPWIIAIAVVSVGFGVLLLGLIVLGGLGVF